jgi:hypothetical protein
MKVHYLGAHAHVKEARQRRRDEKAGAKSSRAPQDFEKSGRIRGRIDKQGKE